MYRNWFWLPIVIGALSSYYLLRSSPGTPGAGYLEVKSVVIGDVVPSSQHRVNVVMTNCGSSRLTGLHAMPSCGCIRVDGLPEQLGAGDQAILTIEIETPSTPGDFKKSVRILSEFHQRDMKISGRVLDILRTEPTRLFIETRSNVDDPIGDSVRVVTKFPETIRWTMKSDEFSVERQGYGPDWVRLKIVGRPTSATGRTQITIADDSRPEGTTVPITWRPPPRFHTVPNRISAGPFHNTASRTIVVLIYGEGAGRSQVDSLVRWVSIEETKPVSDNCLKATIRFDPESLIEAYQGKIAEIRVDSHSENLIADVER
jgi:hypothetical protein